MDVTELRTKLAALSPEAQAKLVEALVEKINWQGILQKIREELAGKIDWKAILQKILENIDWAALIEILLSLFLSDKSPKPEV